MLPTIYEWSVEHIRRVFEAKSEDECRRAINDTFARDVDFISNGKQLSQLDLQRFVLSMVAGSGYRLHVQWQNALEVPRDESNRVSVQCFDVEAMCADSARQDGALGGYYIIRNVRKPCPAGATSPRFARHKFVNVV